ncbi:MAG: hypothetical protein ACYTEZ_08950 [Planctomycetota bacterium]|jgi:serine/threonine protein kinase
MSVLELGRRGVVEWAGTEKDEVFQPAAEKYAVEAPIGAGGMGEVFLVSDQDLRRQVAMKILKREVAEGKESRDLGGS